MDDISKSIAKIERYTADLDEAAFLADEKTTDAVVRNLEIIGEAAKQFPAEFKTQHPEVAWPQIAGLRNRIVHNYAGVDLRLVWNILKTALPRLGDQIANMK